MDQTSSNDYKWKQTLYDAACLYKNNKEYLVNLLQNTSGHDSFLRYMTEINYAALPEMSKALSMFDDDYVTRHMIEEFIIDEQDWIERSLIRHLLR